MKRPLAVLIALVVAAGWLLRAWPALSFGDWWWVPVDYDDAVYFSSAAMLWEGALPYRDFVLLHPPGILLFLAPVTATVSTLGASEAFSLARWAMTLVGAANIALSARVAHRAAGPVAAVAAAVFYAVSPEIVAYERNPYLEPVLNLACLLLANVWLGERAERRPSWCFAAGLCLGFALTVKLWGVLWAIACVASAPSRRALGWLAAGAAVAIALLAGPFLAAAPEDFLEQTMLVQAWRPPDGIARGLGRLSAIVRLSAGIAALALVGLAAAAAGRRDPRLWRSARFFGAAWILLVAAFLVSRTYWYEYNAHLAPAAAHLAGLGAAWLWSTAWARGRAARAAAAALLVVVSMYSLIHSVRRSRSGGNLMEVIGETVRDAIPASACYIALEPAWGLAGDRLPSQRAGGMPIVDVYGTMLLEARHAARADPPTAKVALWTRPPQLRIRRLLEGCEYLSLGWRGEFQLTPGTRRWIDRRWEKILDPRPGEAGVDLWRLRTESRARRPAPE